MRIEKFFKETPRALTVAHRDIEARRKEQHEAPAKKLERWSPLLGHIADGTLPLDAINEKELAEVMRALAKRAGGEW